MPADPTLEEILFATCRDNPARRRWLEGVASVQRTDRQKVDAVIEALRSIRVRLVVLSIERA